MALGGQAVTLRVPHAACIPPQAVHVSPGGHHQLKICIYDLERTLRDVDCDYTLLMFVPVLHHIPDYMSFLRKASQRIAAGGALLIL